MKYLVEKATINQLDEILDLFKNTIKSSCSKDYNAIQIAAWIASINDKEKWIKKIKNQHFIVVKSQNKIAGFGSLENNYVDLLFVDQDFLRRGIASLIYQSLKKESEKKGFTKLTTHASKTAVSFFKSKGFKILKENKVIIREVKIINFEMSQK